MYFERLKKNWWFILSALCFHISLYRNTPISMVSIFLAILSACVVSCSIEDMKEMVLQSNTIIKILSILGVCGLVNYYDGLQRGMLSLSFFLSFCAILHLSPTMFSAFCIFVFSILSIPFFITLFCWAYQWIVENICSPLREMWNKTDVVIFLVGFGLLSLLVIVLFNMTSAFYTNVTSYDVVFTADTPVFFNGDVWVNLLHGENDYRQPLFAVAAAPFFAPLYIVKRIVPATTYFFPLLICQIHITLMLVAGYFISTVFIEKRGFRWLFVALYMSIYSSLLFVVTMEQFTVGTFWLLILVYTICTQGHKKGTFPWVMATGSLTTNIVLLPFICWNKDKKSLWKKIDGFVSLGLRNVGIYLCWSFLFMRFDAIYQFWNTVSTPGWASSQGRLVQFLNFPYSCIFYPKSHIIDYGGHQAWFPIPQENANPISILILVLAIAGACISVFGKKEYIEEKERLLGILTLVWIAFSYFVLCIYGWGTGENCLVLYSLYFGWSYFLGIYLLIRKIFSLIKADSAKMFIGVACVVVLSLYNARNLMVMALSLAPHYPVF